MAAVCEWPVSYPTACPEPDWPEDEDGNTPDKEVFEEMATDLLWNWTGQNFGLCPVQVRPCRSGCSGRPSTFAGRGPYASLGPWEPVLVGGEWFNVSCPTCTQGCSCTYVSTLALPGPIHEVLQIVIDGDPLPQDAYRVDNYALLVRTDGERWPNCQDMSVDVDAPGSWEVSYTRGTPVPVGGQVAAGVLAAELYKAACRDKSCNLPQRIQSITREGVTMAVMDAFEDVEKGRTGIWLIDSWVASVSKTPQRATVRSVDVPVRRGRTTTWP